jgi:hypothetical protein
MDDREDEEDRLDRLAEEEYEAAMAKLRQEWARLKMVARAPQVMLALLFLLTVLATPCLLHFNTFGRGR